MQINFGRLVELALTHAAGPTLPRMHTDAPGQSRLTQADKLRF